MLYLDVLHIQLNREGKVKTVAVYNVLGVADGDVQFQRCIPFKNRQPLESLSPK